MGQNPQRFWLTHNCCGHARPNQARALGRANTPGAPVTAEPLYEEKHENNMRIACLYLCFISSSNEGHSAF